MNTMGAYDVHRVIAQVKDHAPDACLHCTVCGYTTKPSLRLRYAKMAITRHSCANKLAADARYAKRRRRLLQPGQTKPCLHKKADHQHGTHAAYVLDQCRCLPCKQSNRTYERTRNRAHTYGQYSGLIDAEPARQHVRNLQATGLGLKQIERLSGVSGGVMNKLMYGHPNSDGTRRPPARRVKPATAAKILNVRPGTDALAPGLPVDATGTRRRIQALVATGWSVTRLGKELGIGSANFHAMLHRDQVRLCTSRAVTELYERLWNTPPPHETHRDKIAYNRAKGYAAARGWLPPLAWDEDTIDEPDLDAEPTSVEPGLDEVAIEEACLGRPIRLTREERREAVARMTARGLSAKQISERLRRSSRTVQRQRAAA